MGLALDAVPFVVFLEDDEAEADAEAFAEDTEGPEPDDPDAIVAFLDGLAALGIFLDFVLKKKSLIWFVGCGLVMYLSPVFFLIFFL